MAFIVAPAVALFGLVVMLWTALVKMADPHAPTAAWISAAVALGACYPARRKLQRRRTREFREKHWPACRQWLESSTPALENALASGGK